MENERTQNIFYLDLKHVHKYGSAKFQPNPLFSSQQVATESVAEEQKKTKVGKPIGDPVDTGCPNKRPRGLDTLLDLLLDETNIALWIMAM